PGDTNFNYNRHVRTAIPMAVGDTYKGRAIVGTPPKMFVSLSGLHDKIDALITKQRELMNAVREAQAPGAWNDQFAARQAELKGQLQAVREEMKKVAQETTPLLEAYDPLATPSPEDAKWKYGKPVTFQADAAVSEFDAALTALQAKDAKAAAEHQSAMLKALDAVYRSVGAEAGPLEYQPDQTYEIAEGRMFHAWKFEAVIGSEVAQATDLKLGSIFQATHGNPSPKEVPDIHKEKWKVVGVMKPTHTAADRCLYIPLVTFYTIAEHEEHLDQAAQVRQGQTATAAPKKDDDDVPKYKLVYGDELDPDLSHTQEYVSVDAPKDKWEISAIMIKSRGGVTGGELSYQLKNGGLPGVNIQAVNPAEVMREFFNTFFKGSTTVLLVIALLVSIVAAIGILVSIYNSVSARNREIAILRALGATRARILTLICMEAGLIGLFGGLIGVVVGHLFGAVASGYMKASLGQGFNWMLVDVAELLYLALVVAIALAAGLVPALKAYRTPVATNLVAA
ncbi:MAG: ytrF 2, partial [Phycisphaerales bacterium]|nr:ytrF 2 [Phycisphaerales bacterium]